MPDQDSISATHPGSGRRVCGGTTDRAPDAVASIEVSPIPLRPDMWAVQIAGDPYQQPLVVSETALTAFAENWLASRAAAR